MTNKLVVDPTWDLHMALVRPDLNNAEEVEATKEDTNGRSGLKEKASKEDHDYKDTLGPIRRNCDSTSKAYMRGERLR